MLVIIVFLMTPIYMLVIVRGNNRDNNYHGIFRVWPQQRLEFTPEGVTAAQEVRVERLQCSPQRAIAWAMYFSLVASCQIGWRDLNVGTWIARMQFKEYYFRPIGWVRFVSGAQSLICVYLIAICALTYFGRPFQ